MAAGAALAGLLLALPAAVRAQSTAEVQRRIDSSGHTPAEVQARLRATGLSPGQVREALQERGVPPDALDPYLAGTKRTSAPAPADATPPAADAPAGTPRESEPPRPERAPEAPTEFALDLQRRVPGAPAVQPFGYEIFRDAPSTFEPLATGPVDPDYPIGPGDEVIVQVWGDNEFTHATTVSREATISVPDIGQVVVNGLTLAQVKRLVTERLARVYSGIRASRPTTFVDVTLGKLRTVQVFILGDVVRPGGYTISSVSTVLNALYSAGGPTAGGSLRDVRIVRHEAVWRHVDLYGYILTGSRAEDVRLQSGDVVFVPPVGKTVAMLGEVHRPAIYELLPNEGFRDLLGLAGGVRSTALLDRAQVDRVVPFAQRDSLRGQDRVALDLPLRDLLSGRARDAALFDRDIVQVFRIGDVRVNTVTIAGEAVPHPGTFEYHDGMKVSDLVALAGGLTADAYRGLATLASTDADGVRRLRSVDLGLAVAHDPAHDLGLAPLDELKVASAWELRERHKVEITGSVRKPGRYEFLEGMTLTDLVFLAGGLQESASRLEAEVARVDSASMAAGRTARILHAPLVEGFAAGARDTSLRLQPWDLVSVRERPDWQLQRSVTLAGEVRFPGVYGLRSRDERLSSVLQRAGGLNPGAYPEGAVFVRHSNDVGRLAVDVEAVARHGDREQDLVLEDGDSIEIPREPRSVKVVGEVGFPASVLYERGRPLAWYVEQAGGYAEHADHGRVRVVQPNGRVQARHFGSEPRPRAGALVVVPARAPAEKGETLKDVASIVSILAGAATTIFLVRQATK